MSFPQLLVDLAHIVEEWNKGVDLAHMVEEWNKGVDKRQSRMT